MEDERRFVANENVALATLRNLRFQRFSLLSHHSQDNRRSHCLFKRKQCRADQRWHGTADQAVTSTPEPSWQTHAGPHPGLRTNPHFFCNAGELVALLPDFEILSLKDVDEAGDWHWHFTAERVR